MFDDPPGRLHRLGEPPIEKIDEYVSNAMRAMSALPDTPCALMGYSLGAVVAYEIAQRLAALGMGDPLHLFVAASPAPHLRPKHRPDSMTDDCFASAGT